MIRLYNTLTRKKEEFQTLEPNVVKMYVCGVTVYNDAHVGHAMSALVFDIIRRYLEYRGYNVRHVMNYTDVDDKIINRASQLGVEPLKLSQRYIEDYTNDLNNLNVLPATSNPQVSKTMPLIIQFIEGTDRERAMPTRRITAMSISASPGTRITASFPGAGWTICRPARASRWAKRRSTRWTSPYGKPPSPARSSGRAHGARDAPAGTSSARR